MTTGVSKMFRRSALVFRKSLRAFVLVTVVCGTLSQTPRGRAIDSSAGTRTQADSRLHFDGVGYAYAFHDGLPERGGPQNEGRAVLYLPAGMAEPPAVRKLSSDCNVQIEHLPIEIHRLGEVDTSKIQPQGLLYLENKYVVPGGRFNEMYGWDSYFIIRGLLRAGRVELARGMVDNFFFEVEHYGAMLNANRTYYLTRSQPPFLSSMFVDVYDALQKSGHAGYGMARESLCRSGKRL